MLIHEQIQNKAACSQVVYRYEHCAPAPRGRGHLMPLSIPIFPVLLPLTQEMASFLAPFLHKLLGWDPTFLKGLHRWHHLDVCVRGKRAKMAPLCEASTAAAPARLALGPPGLPVRGPQTAISCKARPQKYELFPDALASYRFYLHPTLPEAPEEEEVYPCLRLS